MNFKIAIATVLFAGCAGQADTTNDVGVTYRSLQDNLVEGTLTTSYGSVDFRSAVVADGVADVTFKRGDAVLGAHIDFTKSTDEFSSPVGYQITKDDRFLISALASAIENDIGKETPASDQLFRHASLWGSHPEGKVLLTTITFDPERSWTTLCGRNSATFTHDATSHGAQSEGLAAGPHETSNPCRDRCGPGCSGIGTSAWTVQCGNHDRCEQTHSSTSCADEFTAASDDYVAAGNCSPW